MVHNVDIARILREIGLYLEMQDVQFKPRAYEKAAELIDSHSEEMRDLYDREGVRGLKALPGIGIAIAEKIEEYLKTGRVKYHAELKKKTPVDLTGLTAVEGLGPKKIKDLYKKLKIKNVKDLERAAKQGKIGTLPHFGKKSEDNILKSVGFVKSSGKRFIIGHVLPQVRELEERLRGVKGVTKAIAAGSTRRRKETIGDVDILTVSSKPKAVMDYVVHMSEVMKVIAHGSTKSSVKLKGGLNVDVRVVPRESYGAALNYFTGSKDHNVAMREIAIKKGYKLNEYGLFKRKAKSGKVKEGWRMIAGKTEEEIYKKLGLQYVEPEMREMTGEIEFARAKNLPNPVGYKDLKGDLQVQTNWTDGSHSILEMARAAKAHGLSYMAVTDHTKRLAMMGGLDAQKIQRQWKEIDKVNGECKKWHGGFKVLKGSECDILKDGSLDLPDSILSKLDVVGVSVHSHFGLDKKTQTARVIRAISNPHADIFMHPLSRVIGKREGIHLDMHAVLTAAKKTKTVMEIDAMPDRADLPDEYIKKCVEMGVRLSIDSDAHAPDHFALLEFGIAQARRGWVEKKHVINTRPVAQMLKLLK